MLRRRRLPQTVMMLLMETMSDKKLPRGFCACRYLKREL
jgi:hypothetical protein